MSNKQSPCQVELHCGLVDQNGTTNDAMRVHNARAVGSNRRDWALITPNSVKSADVAPRFAFQVAAVVRANGNTADNGAA